LHTQGRSHKRSPLKGRVGKVAIATTSIAALLVGGAIAFNSANAATTAPQAKASAIQANAAAAAAASAAEHHYRSACPPATPGHFTCNALVRTNIKPQLARAGAARDAAVAGYGPTQLQAAYNLASAAASGGSGQTVAVVDAFDDTKAESDLAVYRSQFGLPACTTANGCFTKTGQNGASGALPAPAPADNDWTGEVALDIDMISATCPNCHIMLVEANTPSDADLGTAVNTAVSQGAKFVSNSYGGPESSSDTTFDTRYYNHPGVAITASSGDGSYGVEYPAASRFVTAVGGTSLSTANNARGWTESVWNTSATEGAGSGCSAVDAKPGWQTDTGCSRRTVADVSAVADPATGVAVYNTANGNGGWNVFGGTSASSPIIASVYALAGAPAAGTNPASFPYAHTAALNDVTTGATASCSPSYLCTAGPGFDGPTGLGTPSGTAAFGQGAPTGGGTPPAGAVAVTNPGNQTGTTGTAASLQISATDATTGQTLAYRATGLPTGLSISATTGLISGTPTAAGTFKATVTATDGAGATANATFTWTVNSATTGCKAGQLLGDPGFESGAKSAPWKATAGVVNGQMRSQPSHSGKWDAWLDGYGQAYTDTLSQTVAVPAGCSHATLSYWLHVATAKRTTQAQDTLKVEVVSASGTTTVAAYSNLNAATGYRHYSIDLSRWAGKSITVTFVGAENSSPQQTSFVLDDTALTIS
jgi:subtilase family serine protease